MKKVLSFVLVLALVLGSFSMAFAAPADVAGTDCEAAVTALEALGVVEGYPDGTYKPENAINRAEAAKLVITALGLAEYAEGNTASFTDLAGYGWAEGYIGYAEALGLVQGDGNGIFRPGDTVSYQEMAAMLVRACGYTDASLPGTWPANYVVKAKALGIMDGIANASAAAANRGDVAIMLYNNLENRIGTINLDNQWIANSPLDTMMSRLSQNLYDPDGVSTGTAVAGDAFVLTPANAVADGVNVQAYLGAKVVAYANADNEITGIKEIQSKFLEGKFDKDGKFVANDVKYVVNTTAGAVMFENGFTTGGAVSTAKDSAYTLAVEVSGKTIKAIHSAAKWTGVTATVTEAMVKNIADAKTNAIVSGGFVLDDNQAIDTTKFVLVGVDSLDKIAKDNVITYYANGHITKIEVGTATVTGKVTEKDLSSSTTKYAIGGQTYSATSNFADLAVGDEGTATLTYAGKLWAWEESKAADTGVYGMLVSTGTALGSYNSASATTQYALEIFTAEGQTVLYNVANKASAQALALPGTANTIVKYTLDKNGKVDSITAPAVASFTGDKVSADGTLIGTKFVADNLVIFETDADNDYKIIKAADLKGAVTGSAVLVKDKIVVLYAAAKAGATSNDTYGLVTKVGYTVVDGDATAAAINIILEGVAKDKVMVKNTTVASAATSATALQKITVNSDGYVTAVTDSGIAATQGATTVKAIAGNYITLADTNTYQMAADVIVYLWDATNSTWKVASTADLGEKTTVVLYDTDKTADNIYDVIMAK